MVVFVLQHERELDGCDDVKLVGIYSSRRAAEAARARTVRLDGFRDHPDGFSIDEYELGRDHWQSGFVTVQNTSERAEPESDRAA